MHEAHGSIRQKKKATKTLCNEICAILECLDATIKVFNWDASRFHNFFNQAYKLISFSYPWLDGGFEKPFFIGRLEFTIIK